MNYEINHTKANKREKVAAKVSPYQNQDLAPSAASTVATHMKPQTFFTKTVILTMLAAASLVFWFFLDIKVVSAAHFKQSPQYARVASVEEIAAAQGMEAIFVNQMIEEMRKSVPENEVVPRSYAEKVYQSMLDQEYAEILSGTGQFGIAEQVLAEITGQR